MDKNSRKLSKITSRTQEERKLVRKVDVTLLSMLWLMYAFNYVDRTNIGNAKIAGMGKHSALNDSRYVWVLSIFFFRYLLIEVPSNMLLSRSCPKLFLLGIMLVWSILSALMTVSKSYGALLAFRIALGCVESGFFLGVLYLLRCWYKSDEIGKRIAVFYTAAVLSGAFEGIIAEAISLHLHKPTESAAGDGCSLSKDAVRSAYL